MTSPLAAHPYAPVTAGPVRIVIRHRADAVATGAVVRDFVRAQGMTNHHAVVAATAAVELAQNIVSHGGACGEMSAWISGETLFVRAIDRGPGLTESPAMFGDVRPTGSYGGSGLGQGSASVRRLMDGVDVRARVAGGLEVIARKSIRWEPVL